MEGAIGSIHFELRLLGSPLLASSSGEVVAGLGPGKPLAVLAYLAVRHEARRDELIELLWGDAPEAKARNAFRQALHRLRTALGEDLVPQSPDSVRLGSRNLISIDRDHFLEACDAGDVSRAVAMYRGDFLEGFELGEVSFDRWVDGERMRLRARLEAILRHGARAALDAGSWEEAIQHAQQLSSVAPFDGDAAELEATVLVAAGRNNAAIDTLQRYTARIRNELDIPVTQSIRDLTARLERAATKQASGGGAARATIPNGTRLPFVGREEELARLVAVVRELASEQGATIVVSGEVGMGKTRLADELLARAQSLGPLLVLRGRERAGGASIPYAGIAGALRGIVQAPGVAGTSRHLLTEAARILPELRDSFELDAPSPIEDEGGRLRFFEGVAAVLDSAAYEQPVCIVLDDLHHTSTSTLDLVGYLSSRLERSPVLLLLIYRSDIASAAFEERMTGLATASRDAESGDEAARGVLRLSPLSQDQTESLVSAYLALKGAGGRIDPVRIAQMAMGRPMRALDLARRAVHGSLASDAPVRPRDILWARLQGSSPSQRRVFFAAALLERSASLRLLAAAAHLPEAATLDAAAALERAGLLGQVGNGYTLLHDATAGFVVESSGVAGRALLAGWAAEALAQEDDATNAELAHLYALAGRGSLAFTHARLAAYSAAAAGAVHEAMRLFGGALTFAPDAKARTEIEDALRGFGGGERWLLPRQSGTVSPIELDVGAAELEEVGSASAVSPLAPHGAAAAEDAPASDPPSAAERLGPWRADVPGRRRRAVTWLAAAIALAVLGGVALRRTAQTRRPDRVLGDSVLVVEQSHQNDLTLGVVTGPLTSKTIPVRGSTPRLRGLTWIDSVRIPWMNPRPSPDGRFVSVERVSEKTGRDIYIIGPGRGDTITAVAGDGQNIALGWSPDSRELLVSRSRTLSDGSYDSDLYSFSLVSKTLTPIDTSSRRAVSEASWSPDGLWVGWVARLGPQHQQDVFVCRPDGSDLENLSNNVAEDDHIGWSPDASLLGFTSFRDGPPHLYAYDFIQRRLWKLTFGLSSDDSLQFSPDGKSVAFESTRDGDAAVYVMAPLGGAAIRITPPRAQFSLVGWRGRSIPYVESVRIIGSSTLRVGDTSTFTILGRDQTGEPIPVPNPKWTLLGEGPLHHLGSADSSMAGVDTGARFRIVATKVGAGRLVVSLPGWRADTLAITSGLGNYVLVDDEFSHGLDTQRWLPSGDPLPRVGEVPDHAGQVALFPNAGRGLGSGILSRETIEIRTGLSIRARMFAPFGQPASLAGDMEIALVPPASDVPPGGAATPPQAIPFIYVNWSAESGHLTYGVGSQTFSEPAAAIGGAQRAAGTGGPAAGTTSHDMRITIDSAQRVIFSVDGTTRWQTPLRLLGREAGVRARLWIGGHATSSWGGAIGAVRAELSGGRE